MWLKYTFGHSDSQIEMQTAKTILHQTTHSPTTQQGHTSNPSDYHSGNLHTLRLLCVSMRHFKINTMQKTNLQSNQMTIVGQEKAGLYNSENTVNDKRSVAMTLKWKSVCQCSISTTIPRKRQFFTWNTWQSTNKTRYGSTIQRTLSKKYVRP